MGCTDPLRKQPIIYIKHLWVVLPLFYNFAHCPYHYYILCFTHIHKWESYMPTLAEQYTLPEERDYLLVNNYHLPYFAPGELSKIVNYDKASHDGYKGWHLHHRFELNPDGTVYKTRDTLILEGIYYQRPATELIFLTDADHASIHAVATNQYKASPNEITRSKMSEAKIKANDTENRFRLVTDAINRGDTLCFRDYAFYRRYCLRNGIPFTGCKVDKTSKVSTVDFEKPTPPKDEPSRFLKQVHRYRGLKVVIGDGHSIGRKDAEFLKRFCTRTGWELPQFKIDWDINIVEIPN